MAEIAAAVRVALAHRQQTGSVGDATPRVLAQGDGWRVADVVCSCGPHDRAFEEQHAEYVVALVVAGAFRHRTHAGSCLLTPGSTMLGNVHDCFECSHEYGAGDRCVSFWFSPVFFDQIASDARPSVRGRRFNTPGIPPIRDTARIISRAGAAVLDSNDAAWDELAVDVAAHALTACDGPSAGTLRSAPSRRDEARIAESIRVITDHLHHPLPLTSLARKAGLSVFHFLRTFERVVGVTPHQFIRRARLRAAARHLLTDGSPIIDIALDSGFTDVSSFNRAFRAEFGVAPRSFRRTFRSRRLP